MRQTGRTPSQTGGPSCAPGALRTPDGRPVAATVVALAAIMLAALGYQIAAGYTPLGQGYRLLVPGGWPQTTAHDRLLSRFSSQIPAGAPLSVSSDLYPHVSHRQLLYQFPVIGQAAWVLVDVSGTTDRPATDVHQTLLDLLHAGWGVADAADGYVLLARDGGAKGAGLPDSFYDFARAWTSGPAHALDFTFGGKLKLLGYDVIDDPKWRRTGLRYYWQALAPLPAGVAINVQVMAPDGAVVDDNAQRPMAALVWYPPYAWRTGETVVITSDPWYLPAVWAPVVQVTAGGQQWVPSRGPGVGKSGAWGPSDPGTSPTDAAVTADGRLRLPAWARSRSNRGDGIGFWTAPPTTAVASARYVARDGWNVTLAAYGQPGSARGGSSLPLLFEWRASGPAPRSYTIFVHLADRSGREVTGGDATPVWFTPLPTTGWPSGAAVLDMHTLALPAGLPSGRYALAVGWYYWADGGRLAAESPAGNAVGDQIVLGTVDITTDHGPQPDLSCLLIPATCASQ